MSRGRYAFIQLSNILDLIPTRMSVIREEEAPTLWQPMAVLCQLLSWSGMSSNLVDTLYRIQCLLCLPSESNAAPTSAESSASALCFVCWRACCYDTDMVKTVHLLCCCSFCLTDSYTILFFGTYINTR